MVPEKGKSQETRQRLVELITLFSRCRQEHGIVDGCGGGKPMCTPCPYEKEHSEMWLLLGQDDFIREQGMEAVKSLLSEDVFKELYPVEIADLGTGWIQYKCRMCQGVTAALKDSLCGHYLVCGTCARKKPLGENAGLPPGYVWLKEGSPGSGRYA